MLLPHRYCRPPPGIPPGTMSSAGQSAANRAAASGGEETRKNSYVILKCHRHPEYCHRTLEYYTKRSEGVELQLFSITPLLASSCLAKTSKRYTKPHSKRIPNNQRYLTFGAQQQETAIDAQIQYVLKPVLMNEFTNVTPWVAARHTKQRPLGVLLTTPPRTLSQV